jgi:2-dehydropantoate 2-reductase
MEIVVFGAGSLGSLIGGLLATAHDVTLVGRQPHMAAIEGAGLRISGARETTVYPETTTDGTGLSASFALVTVKAGDTDAAAAALATGSIDVVCSLQNGVTEERLAAALAIPVLAGTTTAGAQLLEPGHVAAADVGRVAVGAYERGAQREGRREGWQGTNRDHADRVASAFRAAGFDALAADDMPRRRWEKLAVNAAINPVTALTRVDNGAVGTDPYWPAARAAACETAAVARATGVDLSDAAILESLRDVIESTASNRSSMLQDVLAGRHTEIGAITGTVIERAEGHGVSVPTTRLLDRLVRGLEEGQ